MPLQEWSETTLIAEMNDEPVFSEEMEALVSRLEEAGDEMPDVIVNLKAVSRLNSSNLAQLLRLRKLVLGGHRRLKICSVDDAVWSLLLMTGLEKIFEFSDDVTTSLTALQIEEAL